MKFCPHDFHGTTETDLQQMAAGDDYWFWIETVPSFAGGFAPPMATLSSRERAQKIVTDKAHALAVERNLIPYTQETFSALMDEVEKQA